MFQRPLGSTLFPYTTLFRSVEVAEPQTKPNHWLERGNPKRLMVFSGRSHPERSEEHTSELQSHVNLVCRLLLAKKKESFSPSCDPSFATRPNNGGTLTASVD